MLWGNTNIQIATLANCRFYQKHSEWGEILQVTLVLRHWHHLSTFLLLSKLRFASRLPVWTHFESPLPHTAENGGSTEEIFKTCCLKTWHLNVEHLLSNLGLWIHNSHNCPKMRSELVPVRLYTQLHDSMWTEMYHNTRCPKTGTII